MIDVTWIVVGVIFVIGGLLAAFGLPFLRSKLSVEQLEMLSKAAQIAVFAAEQILGPKMGKDKKAFAIDYVKNLLAKWNLTFDDAAVDAAIEAQVKELKITEGAQT